MPVHAQPPGQTVRGVVLDRDTRALLPGAHVVVAGTMPVLGTASDADGRFVLRNVPLGRQTIRVTYVGFDPVEVADVVVAVGREVVLEVTMRERPETGAEMVVNPEARSDRALRDVATVSAHSFSAEESRRYAGGADDPARTASAFAGVAATGGVQENALAVRGNAPKGVHWRLEGIEIPNPNHFAGLTVAGGGGLTLFSAHLLADTDMFTGAFPAAYGNALSAVFDTRFRSGNPEQREHALQVGVIGVEAASEGPFRRGAPATYLFNYRYSTLGLLLPLLPTKDVPTYQDLAFKVSVPTRRAGRFEAWGLGGLDGQKMAPTRDSSAWAYELWDRTRADLALSTGAAGISHHLLLGRDRYLRTTVAVTGQRTAWTQDRLDDDLALRPRLRLRSTATRVAFAAALHQRLGARHTNRTGFDVQRLGYALDVRAAPLTAGPLATVARGHGASTLASMYSQSRLAVSSSLSVTGGLHVQHLGLTGATSIEPRGGVRYDLPGGHALRLGYGLHSQADELRVYLVEHGDTQPNRRLDFTRAHHLVAGYDRRLGAATTLRLEAYAQLLFDVPVVQDSSFSMLNFRQDWSFAAPLVNAGAGRNEGVEMTLDRPLRGGYYVLLTGSLFRARYRGGDGVWRATRFDQRYAANALLGREITIGRRGNLLGGNVRLMAVGGERQSPVDAAASWARQEVVLDERQAFTERAPGTRLLDVTVTYRRNRRRTSEVWALQLKNAFAAQDVTREYNYAHQAVEEVREGFPLPLFSYKLEF